MGLLQTGVDYFLVYRFIRALTTPFTETKAFELGIIDAEGNFLKKFKQLKTKEDDKNDNKSALVTNGLKTKYKIMKKTSKERWKTTR